MSDDILKGRECDQIWGNVESTFAIFYTWENNIVVNGQKMVGQTDCSSTPCLTSDTALKWAISGNFFSIFVFPMQLAVKQLGFEPWISGATLPTVPQPLTIFLGHCLLQLELEDRHL